MPKYFLLILCFLAGCSDHNLRLGATTTLNDSGLLTMLTNEFYRTHGITIKPIVAGSGQILTLLERGDIDIAITHDPQGEQALLTRGVISLREPLFYNYFLFVGPRANPAQIRKTQTLPQALDALINHQSVFVSRADASGTHRAEKALWSHLGKSPKETSTIRTGSGMGATLTVAAEQQAYTLVDLATWLSFHNKQQLVMVWQQPENIRLRNTYSLLSTQSSYSKAEQQTKEPPAKEQPVALFHYWMRHKGRYLASRFRIQQHSAFFIEN